MHHTEREHPYHGALSYHSGVDNIDRQLHALVLVLEVANHVPDSGQPCHCPNLHESEPLSRLIPLLTRIK